MSDQRLIQWEKKSKERQKAYKQMLDRVDKNKVLRQLPDLHEEAFQKIFSMMSLVSTESFDEIDSCP